MKKITGLFKNLSIIPFAVAAAVLCISLSMFHFKNQVNSYIDIDMRSQIEAIRNNSTGLVRNEMNYLKRLTASAAQLMSKSQVRTDQDILRLLEEYAQSSDLVRSLFVTLDGHVYTNYNGYLGQNQSQTSIDGIPLSEIQSPVFSQPFYSDELNELIFGVVCPLTLGDKKGVLVSSYNVIQFHELLKSDFIGGTAEIGIINNQGKVVIGKDISDFDINIFEGLSKVHFSNASAEAMQADLANGKSGFSSYCVGDVERYCSYAPIGLNDWYIIVIVKELSLRSSLIQLEKHGLQLTFELVVIMIALLFVIITARYGEQKKVRTILQKAAMYDGLTGIYNRSTAEAEITHFLELENKKNSSAMMIIDIDNFKSINDNWGHIFGDLVLKECALRMKEFYQEEAIIGRMGGDEFVVLLKDYPGEQEMNEKLDRFINNFQVAGDSHKKRITVSVGIALSCSGGLTFMEMYQQADASLYRAKQQGKGRYSF